MSYRTITAGLTLVVGLAATSGCSAPPSATAPHAHNATSVQRSDPSPATQQSLDLLSREMARYKTFANAQKDGYSTAITGCMQNPPVGGMGIHYGKTTIIDGQLSALDPEVLMYEPGRGGKKVFVGVEFIVPFSAWTDPSPPVLYEQTFAANQTFQVWALHVWVGRENPSGVFADWNPNVSC